MKRIGIALLAGGLIYGASAATATFAAEPVNFDIGGKYVLTAPANWTDVNFDDSTWANATEREALRRMKIETQLAA